IAASIAAVVIIATVLEPWASFIRLATPNPRNRKTMPESVPDAAPPDCRTNARSITDPIPVACSATPNPPLAAMIRIITPALINDVSTISARSARLAVRCRAYTHMAIPVPTRSEEHTSELQSQSNLVCRLLLEKKKTDPRNQYALLITLLDTAPSLMSTLDLQGRILNQN